MNRPVRSTRRLLDLALLSIVASVLGLVAADDGDDPAARPDLKMHSSGLAG